MIPSRGHRESRRQNQDFSSEVDVDSEQFGEPEVIASGLGNSAKPGFGDCDSIAEFHVPRFFESHFARQINVEQMQLSISRSSFPWVQSAGSC